MEKVYECLKNITHDWKVYLPGSQIELSNSAAKPLLELKAIGNKGDYERLQAVLEQIQPADVAQLRYRISQLMASGAEKDVAIAGFEADLKRLKGYKKQADTKAKTE